MPDWVSRKYPPTDRLLQPRAADLSPSNTTQQEGRELLRNQSSTVDRNEYKIISQVNGKFIQSRMEIMDKSNYNVTYLPMKNNQQLPKAQPAEKAKPATFMCGGLRMPYLVIYTGKNPFEDAL